METTTEKQKTHVITETEENEEYDTVNVWADVIEGLKEILEARQNGLMLPNVRDLLKEIEKK
jgi:hypothetical protein